MSTLLSHICSCITGSPLPDGIFDDYFFYQLRLKKKFSDTLLDGVKQIGKHTPHQLAILGFPPNESCSNVEKILCGPKFSDYFFEGGIPSYISILSDPIDYGIHEGHHHLDENLSVTLYFEDKGSMIAAGQRIYHQGTHPQKGYKLRPMNIGHLSKCSHCENLLSLISEKHRHAHRWVRDGGNHIHVPKYFPEKMCTTCSDIYRSRLCK
jgi:hypothetical protein